MNLDLSNKKALVCGSTQGLGLASAIELSLLGADVILLSRNGENLKEALKKLDQSKGQKHHHLVADFQFPEQVEHVVKEFLGEGNTVNILVNNTGGPKGGNAMDATADDFISAFQSHLICNQLLVQSVLPSMKASGFGRIINIISISVKEPIAGLAVSNTIRGAVAAWSKTLANELGEFGITVNNVLPGYTRTARYNSIIKNKAASSGINEKIIEEKIKAQIPLGEIGQPELFGAAVAFLCSPSASYITGINLPVDGGILGCL
ncbi:MAG: SDR family oxidoreductase [Ginsengibacter sp.]|jgi:3-oxoacyl-[acyl-carrier protein] reductase